MNSKKLIIKNIIFDIEQEIKSLKNLLYWDFDNSNLDKYLDEYYPSIDDIIYKSKIWVELNLEHIRYCLSITRNYLKFDKICFKHEDVKNIVDKIKNLYCDEINVMFEKAKTLQRLDIINNVIKQKIKKIELEDIKYNVEINKIIENLDDTITIVGSGLNGAISNFNNLYRLSSMVVENKHIKDIIIDLKNSYFKSIYDYLQNWYRLPFANLYYESMNLGNIESE